LFGWKARASRPEKYEHLTRLHEFTGSELLLKGQSVITRTRLGEPSSHQKTGGGLVSRRGPRLRVLRFHGTDVIPELWPNTPDDASSCRPSSEASNHLKLSVVMSVLGGAVVLKKIVIMTQPNFCNHWELSAIAPIQ